MKKVLIKLSNERGKTLKGSLSRLIALLTIMASFLIGFSGCKKRSQTIADDIVLLETSDDILTLAEVNSKIPVGINPNDSIALFHEIINNWIRQKVLTAFAEERLYDLELIERKVAEYRNRLILLEYISQMSASNNRPNDFSQDEIKKYYETHQEDFISDMPVVKGLLVMIPEKSPSRDGIRKVFQENGDSAVDIIEKELLGDALHYDCFIDKWTSWETIASRIPYRFNNPDSIFDKDRDFETVHNGVAYMLHISSVVPGGNVKPLEAVKEKISDVLSRKGLQDYENELVNSLIKKAVNEKKLIIKNYDPLTSKMNP